MKKLLLIAFAVITGFTQAQVKKKTPSTQKPKTEKKWVNPVQLTKEERNRPYMDEVLKTRDSITPEEAERRRKNIAIGNPFAKYGYYPKIATLSKGKYLEFHDTDSIVVIGSIRYNTKSGSIIEVREIDLSDPDAQPIGDTHGRWISPDPLSEEFSSWTPYNYANNNPINNIDPSGMATEGVLNDYKLNQNGKVELIKTTDDKSDTLYATDKKGNVDTSKSVTVDKAKASDGSIIGDLGKTNNGVSAGYTNNVNDAVNVFNFLNGNTKDGIEFGLGRFLKNGSSENYLIATQHAFDENTKGFAYMQKYIGGDNNLIAYYHNHDGYSGNHPGEIGNQWGDGEGGDQRTRRIIQTENLKVGDMLSRFFTVHQGLGNSLIEYTRYGHRNTGLKMTPANVKSINKNNYDDVRK